MLGLFTTSNPTKYELKKQIFNINKKLNLLLSIRPIDIKNHPSKALLINYAVDGQVMTVLCNLNLLNNVLI